MKAAHILAAAALVAAPAQAQDAPRTDTPGSASAGPGFVSSGGAYPFSDSVAAGEMVYLSGVIGTGADGALVPGGIEAETRAMMEGIGRTLAAHGLDFSAVFKCTVFLADMADWPAFNAVYTRYFAENRFPARSAFGATALALGARVELECMAYRG